VTEKFRSFSEPGQKISAEPTTSTASTESVPEPVFLPADSTRTLRCAELPHRPSRESPAARSPTVAIKGPRRACRGHSIPTHIPIPIPSPTIHLTPSTSSEPAPHTTSDSASDPRLPIRSLP
jgi:hypothetical protein